MSIITKENFYTAYFIDDARENIEVLLKAPNFDSGKVEVTPHVIQYDEEHPDCKDLLELCDLEQFKEGSGNILKEIVKDIK